MTWADRGRGPYWRCFYWLTGGLVSVDRLIEVVRWMWGQDRTLPLLIAKRCPKLIVEGLDLSEEMISRATTRAVGAGIGRERLSYRVGEVAALPYEGSVDLVVSSLSLHHWTDVPAGLAEVRRVLRPGGQPWIYDVRARSVELPPGSSPRRCGPGCARSPIFGHGAGSVRRGVRGPALGSAHRHGRTTLTGAVSSTLDVRQGAPLMTLSKVDFDAASRLRRDV